MKQKNNFQSSKYLSIIKIFFKILILLYVTDLLIEFLFIALPNLNNFVEAFLDAFLVTLISSPFLWLFIVYPVIKTSLIKTLQSEIIVNNSIDGIIIINEKKEIILLNPAAEAILNYPKKQINRQHINKIFADFDKEILSQQIDNLVLNNNSFVKKELRATTQNNHKIITEVTISLLFLQQEKFFLLIVRDITENKKMQEQILRLYKGIEQSPSYVMITDINGNIEYVNPKFIKETGYSLEELKGKNPKLYKSNLYPQDFYSNLWSTIKNGKEWSGEFYNKKKNGQFYWESACIYALKDSYDNITGFIKVAEDITQQLDAQKEKAKLEEQLMQSQKLDSLGQLATGIAHDFNNLLTSSIGFAELILEEKNLSPAIKQKTEIVVKQGRRAAELNKQILDFSRKSPVDFTHLNIIFLVKENLKFLERIIPETIKINLIIENDNLIVNANPTQIQQVITNLIINARDAMPTGGAITVKLSKVKLNEFDGKVKILNMLAGNYVALEIKDTGTGIPQEIISKLFEPFFTTKKPGKGTGLGLAQVYGIVKQHKGFIDVKSKVNEGATFTIFLPEIVDTSLAKNEFFEENNIIDGGGKFILLIDDNLPILLAEKAMFESLNCKIVIAQDSEEGLKIYSELKDKVSLVVSDMIMPKMRGIELYLKLKEINSKVKIVLVSGYILAEEDKNFLEQNKVNYIPKPLSLQNVKEIIKELN